MKNSQLLVRILAWSSAFVAIVILLAVGSVMVLLHQKDTLPWAINMAEGFIPGTLHIEHSNGSLSGPLELNNLTYQKDGLSIQIKQLYMDWNWLALLQLQLTIKNITLTTVHVKLPPTPTDTTITDTPSPPFAGLVLQLGIGIEKGEINDFWLMNTNSKSPPVHVDHAIISTQINGSQIAIDNISVKAMGVQATAKGNINLIAGLPMALELNWAYRLPSNNSTDQLNISGQGSIIGDLAHLKLAQVLKAPLPINIDVDLKNLESSPSWDAKLALNNASLIPLVPKLPGRITGQLHTVGDLQRAVLTGYFNLSAITTAINKNIIVELDSVYENNHGIAKLYLLNLALNLPPGNINGNGEIILTPDITWAVNVNAKDLDPALFKPDLPGNIALALETHGKIINSQPQLDIKLNKLTGVLRGYPLGGSALLHLKDNEFTVSQLDISSGPNRLNAKGQIGNNLALNLLLKAPNLAAVWPGLAGNLQAQSRISGSISAPVVTAKINGKHLAYLIPTASTANSIPDSISNSIPKGSATKSTAAKQQVTLDKLNANLNLTVANNTRTQHQTPGTSNPTTEPGFNNVNMNLDWKNLRFISNNTPISSPAGSAKISGQPTNYNYGIDTSIITPNIPLIKLSANGTGNMQGLTLANLALNLPPGGIKGNGAVTWIPTITWRAIFQGNKLNPAIFQPELPGNIAFILNTQGQITKDQLQLDAKLEHLNGILRGYPLGGSVLLTMRDSELNLSAIEIRSGPNNFKADGNLNNKNITLNWALTAPNLATIWPGLGGNLETTGTITGSVLTPNIQAKLEGNNIAYSIPSTAKSNSNRQQFKLHTLNADLDIDLANSGNVNLDIQATDLNAAGQKWTAIALNAKGTQLEHQINLVLTGANSSNTPSGQLELTAELSKDRLWQGQLRQLELQIPKFGTWHLNNATNFALGSTTKNVANLCLTNTTSQICGSFAATANQGWSAKLTVPQLAFDIFKPLLPPTIVLTGQAKLIAEADADANGQLSTNANLSIPNGRVKVAKIGAIQNLDFSKSTFTASLDKQAGRAALSIPLTGLGTITGNISLAELDPAHLNPALQSLSGNIKVNLPDLGFMLAFIPQLSKLQGSLNLDYQLGGKLATPKLQGQSILSIEQLDIPKLGLALRNIKLQATAKQQQYIDYQGTIPSGNDQLKFTGTTNIAPAANFSTNLYINGTNWVAIDIPEAKIQISPAIHIKQQGNRTDINGKIDIPYGRIRPRSLPTTAVINSPDLVLKGKNIVAQKQAVSSTRYMNIQVVVGKRVNFDGFGLRADLTGDLMLIQSPGRSILGRGRIGIKEGTYKAYGQDLKIQRGYALFADTPIDNPALDVQAARVVDPTDSTSSTSTSTSNSNSSSTITAGVRIAGTLKKPIMSLFSTPTLAQSDILSYILSGKPMSQSGSGRTAVTSALIGAGVSKVTDEIARQLGIDDLNVETGSNLSSTSVTAGTYISPRLYIQYANTRSSLESTVRLRYDLTDKLQIQTESGKNKGVDLFYTIER